MPEVSWRSLRLPGLIYCLLAFGLSFPAWTSMGDRVIGHPRSDVWKHLWGDAWFREALGSEFPVPIFTTQVGFPDGGMLYNLDPLTGLFSWMLWPLPLVLVHNLVQVGSLVAGGLGVLVLARHLVPRPELGWVAGAVYAFSAHIQSLALASGVSETAQIGGLPWAIWALLRVLHGAEKRAVLTLGITLAWTALGSWYYGLVASIACLALLADWVRVHRKNGTTLRPRMNRAVLGGALGLLLVWPMAESFLMSMDPDTGLHWVGSVGLQESDLSPAANFAVATVSDFAMPGARMQDKVDLLFFSNHPGFIALSLGVLGLMTRPRRGAPLAVGVLVSALLCMGPVIYLDRSQILGPNPVFLLFQALWPGFDMVQNLERMQVGLSLCLGLLAAMGLSALVQSLEIGRRGSLCVGLLACMAVVVEANLASGIGFPLPTASTVNSEIYSELAHREGDFAIIELPIHHGGGGRPYWHQVEHGRPLPLSLDGNPPVSLQDNALMAQFLSAQRYNRFYLKHRSKETALEDLIRARIELSEMGFSYVILTDTEEQPEQELRRLLDSICGYPIEEDHAFGVRVYRL